MDSEKRNKLCFMSIIWNNLTSLLLRVVDYLQNMWNIWISLGPCTPPAQKQMHTRVAASLCRSFVLILYKSITLQNQILSTKLKCTIRDSRLEDKHHVLAISLLQFLWHKWPRGDSHLTRMLSSSTHRTAYLFCIFCILDEIWCMVSKFA